MTLNLAASLLCFLVAGMIFLAHSMTGPKGELWVTCPWYVRIGFFFTGGAFLVRGANLTMITTDAPGAMNFWAMLVLCLMAYTVSAVMLHVALQRADRKVWEKTGHLLDLGKKGETLDQGAVLADAAAAGILTVPPSGSVADLIAATKFKTGAAPSGPPPAPKRLH